MAAKHSVSVYYVVDRRETAANMTVEERASPDGLTDELLMTIPQKQWRHPTMSIGDRPLTSDRDGVFLTREAADYLCEILEEHSSIVFDTAGLEIKWGADKSILSGDVTAKWRINNTAYSLEFRRGLISSYVLWLIAPEKTRLPKNYAFDIAFAMKKAYERYYKGPVTPVDMRDDATRFEAGLIDLGEMCEAFRRGLSQPKPLPRRY